MITCELHNLFLLYAVVSNIVLQVLFNLRTSQKILYNLEIKTKSKGTALSLKIRSQTYDDS